MNNDLHHTSEGAVTGWRQHRFLLLVLGAIVVAIVLVSVGLTLYRTSGAAQLDLSRPGYEDVREQAKPTGRYEGFSNFGPINEEVLTTFEELYTEQAENATAVDAFGGDVLSDEALKINAP